jgi:hypothetical protein
MACRSRGPRFVCLIIADNLMGVGYANTETGGYDVWVVVRGVRALFVTVSLIIVKGLDMRKLRRGKESVMKDVTF